ncbi:MAG TPA: DUF5522 domain-containing protein [Chitinophagaceae bacterium]
MKELIENIDYYINKDGYVVLTKKYHLEKGNCCGNGCLHCPYYYENVPEPRKTELTKRKENSEK